MPPDSIPRRRRPPWWPENEPWPPNGPQHWRDRRGRFFWRMGCSLALIIALAYGGCALFVALVISLSGAINSPQNSSGFVGPAAIVMLLLSLAGIFWIGRSFRRAAQPIGDVMEVAGRLAAGDYSARVRERGPHEVRALAHEFNIMAERLQSNDDQRRRLLADVTHELRTPLTVIQGNLEGMLDGIYQPDQTHLESTLEETRVLSRLIDDLRTLALTESGALKLQLEPTDPGVLLNEVAASFQPQAKAAGVQLSADSITDLPLIEIDPARIRQVLTNLIANALRYTSGGGAIYVQGKLKDAAIEITVRDTGRGIAPQDLPHIFDRYYKSSDSRGTGLGLAIAKSLVTAHGGEITAQSEVGQGTTIAFRLPVIYPSQV